MYTCILYYNNPTVHMGLTKVINHPRWDPGTLAAHRDSKLLRQGQAHASGGQPQWRSGAVPKENRQM